MKAHPCLEYAGMRVSESGDSHNTCNEILQELFCIIELCEKNGQTIYLSKGPYTRPPLVMATLVGPWPFTIHKLGELITKRRRRLSELLAPRQRSWCGGGRHSFKGCFGSVSNGVCLNQRAGRVCEYRPSSAFHISIS
jgi:hypothetical protein